MPIRYVNPNAAASGNGTTSALSGANCAYQRLYDAINEFNGQTLSEVLEIICDSGGTADTQGFTVGGITTSASNYIYIHPNASHRSLGKWSTDHYRMAFASENSFALTITSAYTRIDGLNIEVTAASESGTWGGIYVNANNVSITNCLVKGAVSGTNAVGYGIYLYEGTGLVVRNSIVYNFVNATEAHAGFRSWIAGGNSYSLDNCTVYNCYVGYLHSTGTRTSAKNLGAAGCTTAFSGWTPDGGDTCSSSTPTFVSTTGGSEDLHLAASDTTWHDAGTDLSGTFTTDIDGETRVTWDIGADEYLSAGGSSTPIFQAIRGITSGICRGLTS